MLIAVAVLIISSFMLIGAHVRGWLPAVALLGSALLIVPFIWAIGTLSLIAISAPPTLVITVIGSIWIIPIGVFVVDAAINRPIELLLVLPPAAAQVWAISSLLTSGLR